MTGLMNLRPPKTLDVSDRSQLEQLRQLDPAEASLRPLRISGSLFQETRGLWDWLEEQYRGYEEGLPLKELGDLLFSSNLLFDSVLPRLEQVMSRERLQKRIHASVDDAAVCRSLVDEVFGNSYRFTHRTPQSAHLRPPQLDELVADTLLR